MKELTTEEMSSLKGGFLDSNYAAVISEGNVAAAVPVAANAFGGQLALQSATAYAGNQSVFIAQIA